MTGKIKSFPFSNCNPIPSYRTGPETLPVMISASTICSGSMSIDEWSPPSWSISYFAWSITYIKINLRFIFAKINFNAILISNSSSVKKNKLTFVPVSSISMPISAANSRITSPTFVSDQNVRIKISLLCNVTCNLKIYLRQQRYFLHYPKIQLAISR